MKRRTLLAGAAAFAAAPAIVHAADKTKIVWWHAMTAALGDQVNHAVDAFNQSQDAIEVTAIYKGGYADVLTATIAACSGSPRVAGSAWCHSAAAER